MNPINQNVVIKVFEYLGEESIRSFHEWNQVRRIFINDNSKWLKVVNSIKIDSHYLSSLLQPFHPDIFMGDDYLLFTTKNSQKIVESYILPSYEGFVSKTMLLHLTLALFDESFNFETFIAIDTVDDKLFKTRDFYLAIWMGLFKDKGFLN